MDFKILKLMNLIETFKNKIIDGHGIYSIEDPNFEKALINDWLVYDTSKAYNEVTYSKSTDSSLLFTKEYPLIEYISSEDDEDDEMVYYEEDPELGIEKIAANVITYCHKKYHMKYIHIYITTEEGPAVIIIDENGNWDIRLIGKEV